ncbi:MAG: hypothetical protein ABIR76_16070 [Polaromonas sp.]
MQRKCDLYFYDAVKSDRLKFIELFDKNFVFDSEKVYVGFLHASADRVKLVSVVSDLRRNGIVCFSVPIAYREQKTISMEIAFDLAIEYAKTVGATVAVSIRHQRIPPVFWAFDLVPENNEEEKSGGVVMIDRLDGHVWTSSEYEEYLYDYNNVL